MIRQGTRKSLLRDIWNELKNFCFLCEGRIARDRLLELSELPSHEKILKFESNQLF